MPKRRDKPVENPLKMDLIRNASQASPPPASIPAPAPVVEQEAALPDLPDPELVAEASGGAVTPIEEAPPARVKATPRRTQPAPVPAETSPEPVSHTKAQSKSRSVKPKRRTEPVQERLQPLRKTYDTKTHSMRTRFDVGEHEANVQLVESLQRLMGGSKVTESHITRALWSLARRAEDAMYDNANKAPLIARPPHGNRLAQAEYEDAIADFLLTAFRRTDR